MNIAIYGSCVSRDTCEFIGEAKVLAYVARQSVTSLRTSHGQENVDLGGLTSPFQKRMVTSDLRGTGTARITERADELDLVLIDLVDERRGFWQFSDGTTMTNSLEIEACGAAKTAEESGARLIEFGTNEHFEAWAQGFTMLVEDLRAAELLEKTIMLDIEWACAVDGAQHPQSDRLAKLGRQWRRLQRGARDANRALSNRRSLRDAWVSLTDVKPTEAESFADRAIAANRDYVRYRNEARSRLRYVIVRSSDEVRIGRDHKWGPQPFHYRDSDYFSIVDDIRAKVKEIGGEPQ